MGIRAFLYLAVLMLLQASSGQAEKFLSIQEAQKLYFPKAERFESSTIRFTPEQLALIEKKAAVKVHNKGNRIWKAVQENQIVGFIVLDYVLGKHELIDYAVALSPEGKVLGIEILEYRESYGGEIRHSKWRSQFAGKTSRQSVRLNHDISNISGATMSCRHVTEGVKRVLATFEVVLGPSLFASNRVQDLERVK